MQHSNTAGCILLKFYIKPQHTANVYNLLYVVSYRNSTSNHNMSHWRATSQGVVSYRNSTSNHNFAVYSVTLLWVVSYRNSTSNHNIYRRWLAHPQLYLIEILHQTTTFIADDWPILSCILSKFYIKPQPYPAPLFRAHRCILSKFYIKPQQEQWSNSYQNVVSYRNSTSNHNGFGIRHVRRPVVSYRNSTSNHNPNFSIEFFDKLYLIEILHQTTTEGERYAEFASCILSKFYIKPQQRLRFQLRRPVVSYRNSTSNHNRHGDGSRRAALYLIEILHQTTTPFRFATIRVSCILSKFYIKPQLSALHCLQVWVVSYRNSTSNHNSRAAGTISAGLYLIEILHQTTTK